MQKQISNEDKLIADYDYFDDPAFKTITANVSDDSYLARNKFIVLDEDLENAQTNQTPGSNQYNSVQELQGDILNIQGLPNGFDPSFRSKQKNAICKIEIQNTIYYKMKNDKKINLQKYSNYSKYSNSFRILNKKQLNQ